ncbi:AHH domain-containing protein [Paucisalibacillus globulus]|uniref:AHH domain-containing protein n=1 Tax=Paucisalibacillus globulus TaxID=351095 RepID=UPI001B7FB3B3|nr:AHH domain-containing protein [Paucisalibacillus globulus]
MEKKQSVWDNIASGAGKTVKAVGKAGKDVVDFLFLDDINTIMDDEASGTDKALAGVSFIPIGKVVKLRKVNKLFENGDKVDVKKVRDGSKGKGKPLQNHHYATNKSKKYTPQIESITKKYDLDLDDIWNKEYLPHQGRHPNAYHDYVLDNLRTFDNLAKGDRNKFLKLFEGLKSEIRNNPDMLYKDYWRLK